MNNRSIPSTHAVRKFTFLSDYPFFTLHPSLSPYGWMESQTEERINPGWAG